MAQKFTYKDYKPSSDVTKAQKAVTSLEKQKPGEFQYADYKSQYAGMSEDLMNQYLNREKFKYDINGDALYQQYKDQYINQGKMAMMDTMGQAAAMTGGYGNSYVQSVGQQAYQGYLQQLNDKIPELYQLALDQYNREGDELLNKYGMVTDADDRAYGRWSEGYDRAYAQHRDSVADWQSQLARADENYWNTKNFDYGQYSDNRNLAAQGFYADRDYELALMQFEEEQRRFNEQLALQKKNSVGSDTETGGDPSKNVPPTPSVYESIVEACNVAVAKTSETVVKNGKTVTVPISETQRRNEIIGLISSALNEGKITKEEYNTLRETFVGSAVTGSKGGHYTY